MQEMNAPIPEQHTKEEIDESFAASKAISDLVSRYSIPIYASIPDNEVPELRGTGFLVLVENRLFLVSAAHVLEHDGEHSRLFYFVGQQSRCYLSGLPRRLTPTVKGERAKDRIDIGVVALELDCGFPESGLGKSPVSIDDLSPLPMENSQYGFAISGYPQSRDRPDRKAKELNPRSISWIGVGAGLVAYEQAQLNPRDHVLVRFPRRKVWREDGAGPMIFPKTEGISGAPVWRLFRVEKGRAVESGRPQVAGVAIEERSKQPTKVMVGTNIDTALKMIEELRNKGM